MTGGSKQKTATQKNDSGTLSERLEQLYSQSEMLKMMSMKKFLADHEGDVDELKLSQNALKAIELQLRIIAESARYGETGAAPMPKEVFEALLSLPGVGPILRQEKIRKLFLTRLKVSEDEAGRTDK